MNFIEHAHGIDQKTIDKIKGADLDQMEWQGFDTLVTQEDEIDHQIHVDGDSYNLT